MSYPTICTQRKRGRARLRDQAMFDGDNPLARGQVFDTAFVTLFHVTAGEPWPDELLMIREDGTTDWVVAGYELCFTIIVIWVILQASAACVRARPCGAPRGRCQLPSAADLQARAARPGAVRAAMPPLGRAAAGRPESSIGGSVRCGARAPGRLFGSAGGPPVAAGWPPARRLLRAGACPGVGASWWRSGCASRGLASIRTRGLAQARVRPYARPGARPLRTASCERAS